MSDAHYLVNKAALDIENESVLEFNDYIGHVSRIIAMNGKATHTWGHNKRITPIKARNTIRRLRSLGFSVFFTIRKGHGFEDKYVTDAVITLP
jgi:hypothetical protein